MVLRGKFSAFDGKGILEPLAGLGPETCSGPFHGTDPVQAKMPEIPCRFTPDREEPGLVEDRQPQWTPEARRGCARRVSVVDPEDFAAGNRLPQRLEKSSVANRRPRTARAGLQRTIRHLLLSTVSDRRGDLGRGPPGRFA